MRVLGVTCALLTLAFMAPEGINGLKTSLTTSGTDYSSTYYLPGMVANSADGRLTFHFMVQAVSDARFKLTMTANANQSPVYIKVNLGWASNSRISLERFPRRSDADEIDKPTNGLLSDEEMRPFKLVLNRDTLSLYAGNSVQPLLTYRDHAVEVMKFIAFSAYLNVTAKWSLGEGAPGEVCQPLTTFGTAYSSAYYLPEMDARTADGRLTFNFKVQAVSDARFKLTMNANANLSPVQIKVNLGWSFNSRISLERLPKRSDNDEIDEPTSGLLSDKEMRQFTLVLDGDTLQLYTKNNPQSLLTYVDSSVAAMKYISFSEWYDTTAEWALNCQRVH